MSTNGAIIYVVDDDVSICRALSLLLNQMGLGLRHLHSAEEFLGFKHPKVLSCLILDIRLPNINGFALQEIMAQRGIITLLFLSQDMGIFP